MMEQAEHADAFEDVLLSYAEMCYSVALALTRHPTRAQDLASHVLTWAWRLRDSADGQKHIKQKLLTSLRKVYVKDYCQSPWKPRNEAMRGENPVCVARFISGA